MQALLFNAPAPAAGHLWPTPPPGTPGHPWASLGLSLVGSLLLPPGSWCIQGSVCALHESVSPVLCKFCWLYGGLMATSSKRAYATPRSTAPGAPAPEAAHCWPYLFRRHPNTVLSESLCGLWVLVCTRYVWALWASLVGMGFDSKCDFAPLPSCWGFSLALGRWVSHSCSSTRQPPLQLCSHCSSGRE